MYREGQRVLERGLSRGASIALGTLTALICIAMAAMAASSTSPMGFYLFSLFCGLIAGACFFTGRVRQIFGRLIGAAVFTVSAWYLLDQLSGGSVISDRRSQPSIVNAMIFLAVAGAPGLVYALRGRFGRGSHKSTE